MWDHKYYISEAAEILDVPFRTIKGWYERHLIAFAKRDTSLPGHPYLITHVELLRLAVALEVQRLFRDELGAKWNPGPFLKVFRSAVPDEELHHLPEGARHQIRGTDGQSDERFRQELDEEAKQRANDLLLAIRRVPDKTGHERERAYVYRLKSFQHSITAFLVQEMAWFVVNVSNVARHLRKRLDDLEKAEARF